MYKRVIEILLVVVGFGNFFLFILGGQKFNLFSGIACLLVAVFVRK